MTLPSYTDLYAPNGLQAFDALFNSLLDLLEAQKSVDFEEVELTMNGATETAAGLFPAKVHRLGVSWRVTQAVTASGGGTTFKVGDGTDDDRYGTGGAFALNSSGEDVATADPSGWFAAAGDVVFTPNAGAFTAGKVMVRAYFLRTAAPPEV